MNNRYFFTGLMTTVLLFSFFTTSFAFAHPHYGQIEINGHSHEPQTEYLPLTETMTLEKTSVFFHVDDDNILPWGFVEGKIANHVSDYPIIIQFYNKDGDASHFAQTNVNDDGSYEYKFRVRNVDDGNIINVFEGDYSVLIFKVVYLHPNENLI